jgi:hypothetical protein
MSFFEESSHKNWVLSHADRAQAQLSALRRARHAGGQAEGGTEGRGTEGSSSSVAKV